MAMLTIDYKARINGYGTYREVFMEYMNCVRRVDNVQCFVTDRNGRPWRTDRLNAQMLAYSAKHLKLDVSPIDQSDHALIESMNPRAGGDGFGTIAFFLERYDINEAPIDKDWFDGWDEMYQFIMTPKDEDYSDDVGCGLGAVAALPMFMIDHSGLSFSTRPFGNMFDSRQVGFIYATKEDAETFCSDANDISEVKDILRAAVDMYNKWQRGEMWGYKVYDPTSSSDNNIVPVDGLESHYFSETVCRKLGEETLEACKKRYYSNVRERMVTLEKKKGNQ